LIAETPEAHEVQLPQAQSELTGADEMLEAFNVLPKPAAPSFAIRAEDPLVGVTSGAPKVQLPQINSELRGADNELEKIAEAPGAGKTMPPILGIAAVILVAVLTLLYFTLGKH